MTLTFLRTFFFICLLCCLGGCERGKLQTAQQGKIAPDPGALYLNNDQPVELQKYRGKPLVMLFFANSCCSDELEEFEKFINEQQYEKMNIIAVNVGDSLEDVKQLRKEKHISFPLAYDPIHTSTHRYKLMAIPTVYIIGDDGVVLGRIIGKVPFEQLTTRLLNIINGDIK